MRLSRLLWDWVDDPFYRWVSRASRCWLHAAGRPQLAEQPGCGRYGHIRRKLRLASDHGLLQVAERACRCHRFNLLAVRTGLPSGSSKAACAL